MLSDVTVSRIGQHKDQQVTLKGWLRTKRGSGKVQFLVLRDGKNVRGWLLGLVLGTVGKGVLNKAFVNTVKAIEARNSESLPIVRTA